MRPIRQTIAQLIAGKGYVVQPAPVMPTERPMEALIRDGRLRLSRHAPVSEKRAMLHQQLIRETYGEKTQ
jgi:hypothetical protein